ncbi:MAG: aminotransferase class V-fold PLP-dependent enzyme, partial [Sphingomonas sp.]
IFTSGTSEALSIVLSRAVAARRLIAATEHDSVIRASVGAAMLPVDRNGVVDLATLDAALAGGATSVVAVQWANSETGVLQPLDAIAARVHALGGLLLVDAAQAPPGTILACTDFVALSSHKRGGPAGIGALLVRDLATLEPSGGQERGYRSGTENVPGALGYAAALADIPDSARWSALRARLDDAIVRSGGEVVARDVARHPAIGSYRMPGVESAVQLIRFDLAGIAVSAGSACASGSMKPSHVLTAMGWSERAAREVVRISFGVATSDSDVDAAIAAWRAIARDARSKAA